MIQIDSNILFSCVFNPIFLPKNSSQIFSATIQPQKNGASEVGDASRAAKDKVGSASGSSLVMGLVYYTCTYPVHECLTFIRFACTPPFLLLSGGSPQIRFGERWSSSILCHSSPESQRRHCGVTRRASVCQNHIGWGFIGCKPKIPSL